MSKLVVVGDRGVDRQAACAGASGAPSQVSQEQRAEWQERPVDDLQRVELLTLFPGVEVNSRICSSATSTARLAFESLALFGDGLSGKTLRCTARR